MLDSQALDFETLNSYTFSIQVRENLKNLRFPADNVNSAITAAQVNLQPTKSNTTNFHRLVTLSKCRAVILKEANMPLILASNLVPL